jgi:hypothetical protein
MAGGSSESASEAFLTAYTNAVCQKFGSCGSGLSAAECATVNRALFGSVEAAQLTGLVFDARALARGTASFNAPSATACLAAVAATPCELFGSIQGVFAMFACVDVVRPTAASGGACVSRLDCLDSSQTCNGTACARTCSVGGNLGEACKDDLTCNDPWVCIQGVCRSSPPAGTPCSGDSDCGSRALCRTQACVPLPPVGQPCLDLTCQSDAVCVSGVCQARRPVGQACTSRNQCLASLRCVGGLCQPRAATGATCGSSSDCEDTASCRAGRCTPISRQGQSCTAADCASGLICDEVTRTCERARPAAMGEACGGARLCSAPLVCRGFSPSFDGGLSTAGTCGLAAVGDACLFQALCGPGRYCDLTTRSCRDAATATPCDSSLNCRSTDFCTNGRVCATKAASGQVCEPSSRSSCATAGEVCVRSAPGADFRCQRPPAIGQPCDGSCAGLAACLSRQCVAAGALGQPCLDGVVPCLAGACLLANGTVRGSTEVGGTCQPPRAEGQPCRFDVGCQSGFCDRQAGSAGVCVAACR